MIEKTLFYTGSILGILAFFRPFIKSGIDSNREKWKEVQGGLTEKDISNLQKQVYVNRSVDPNLLSKVQGFVHDFEKDLEYTRLGFPFKRKFDHRKESIRKLYYELTDYIQAPYWRRESSRRVGAINYWNFEKEYFEKRLKDGHQKYQDHLREASEIVDKIRINYRAMSYLVDLNMIQIPVANRIVKKRSKLLYK